MFNHQDRLSELNKNLPLNAKLKVVHQTLKKQFDFVDRISVALHDRKTSMVRTFLASGGRDYPLEFYETRMEEAPSLQKMAETGQTRVINDLAIFAKGEHEHTKRIIEQGYRASYTTPMYFHDTLAGFVFFDSYQIQPFDEEVLKVLDVYSHLIAFMVEQETGSIKAMLSALKSVSDMVRAGKPEPGAHLERVSRFSRLIAQALAESGKYDFSDEDVERIAMFSRIHDAGRIGSAGNASAKAETIQSHTIKGLQLIDSMIENFGNEPFDGVDVLRNIAQYHHERMDGSGYPSGLRGQEIPIEARIVAVAEIFDSMTSRRPYKQAWSNDEAFSMLQRMSRAEIDLDCVNALMKKQDQVEEIQVSFLES